MNSDSAITMRGIAQFFDGLRVTSGPSMSARPVAAGGGIKIRALADLIARTLPALANGETGDRSADADYGPLTSSWFTLNSGQYARMIGQAGGAGSTWTGQSLPAYADVSLVSMTPDDVYVSSTGLPSHLMGLWSKGAMPRAQRRTYRIPRTPWLTEIGVTTAPGAVGVWVNGVPIDNMIGGGRHDFALGRDVEDPDPTLHGQPWLLHQAAAAVDPANGWVDIYGGYRYFANPLALRCQLRDNVIYLPRTDCYREDVGNLRHSPILGWTFEGLPVYGPYGYSDPLDMSSSVRRMVSGFVLRDGSNGTVDLSRRGRRTLPRWAASMHGLGERLAPQQVGPEVSTEYELGRYVEDYDYLGDLGGVQGRDFDLDLCNGRYCVTPEFPNGTFAYFVSVGVDGAPVFPFVVGPRSYGVRDGGLCDGVPEEAEAVVKGGVDAPVRLDFRSIGRQHLLTWTSVEGGWYRVDGSVDGRSWNEVAVDVASGGLMTEYTVDASTDGRPYRHFMATLTSTNEVWKA